MLETSASPTVNLWVDPDALASNWKALQRMSGSGRVGAAVKADCYGLGAYACVPVLHQAGCNDFFVAHWGEVEAIAHHAPGGRISVLHGPISEGDCGFAMATGAVPVINSLEQARLWNECGGGECDLMVDTGMNRLGISPKEIGDPVIQNLQVHTLMSHLACADEDSEMNSRQLDTFTGILGSIGHKYASLANSAGIALGREFAFDISRPGLALYGGVPRPEMASEIKQVAFPQAAVLQVREIAAGDSIGYNARFVAEHDMRIATVSVGYADGFLRVWGDCNAAFTRDGAKLPLLGKVSMDMVVVDCANLPELRAGDWLDIPYHLPDAAQQTSLSQYELLTILGNRMVY